MKWGLPRPPGGGGRFGREKEVCDLVSLLFVSWLAYDHYTWLYTGMSGYTRE